MLKIVGKELGGTWNGIVSHTPGGNNWGYSIPRSNDDRYHKSNWLNGYSFVVFKPLLGSNSGGPNETELKRFMNSILPVDCSGDCTKRATRMNDLLKKKFPGTSWCTIVKKLPDDDNYWAYNFPVVNGCKFRDRRGEYCYAASRCV